MVETRRAAVSRGDSPADVQMARSFVAVIAGLLFASCVTCHAGSAARVAHWPLEIRAVAMILGGGAAALRIRD